MRYRQSIGYEPHQYQNDASMIATSVILPFRMSDVVYIVLLTIIITLKYSSSQLTKTTTSCDDNYYVEVINDLRNEVANLQNRMTQAVSLLQGRFPEHIST